MVLNSLSTIFRWDSAAPAGLVVHALLLGMILAWAWREKRKTALLQESL